MQSERRSTSREHHGWEDAGFGTRMGLRARYLSSIRFATDHVAINGDRLLAGARIVEARGDWAVLGMGRFAISILRAASTIAAMNAWYGRPRTSATAPDFAPLPKKARRARAAGKG